MRLLHVVLASASITGLLYACSTDGSLPGTDADAGSTSDSGGPDVAQPSTDAGTVDADAAPPATYLISGTVAGLKGTGLVLQNNLGDDLAVAADGSFQFATKLGTGAAYAVTVKTQPSSPSQVCTVSGGSGAVGTANVSSITVNCSTSTFTISGGVTGLVGSGLVLTNNGGDPRAISNNGTFAFATPVTDGSPYAVAVETQPSNPTQHCVVTDGSGDVSGANVSNVAVACTTSTFDVGGKVSGLLGTGLKLRNNGGDEIEVTQDGDFEFPTKVASNAGFEVTVSSSPTGPVQHCEVTGGAGTVVAGAVSSVVVNCSTKKFAIGGHVTGLAGSGLVLTNNDGDPLPINDNGEFGFGATVASGATYAVKVKDQPSGPTQECVVTNGNGTVDGSPITDVAIACTTKSFKVSGSVVGLAGSGLVLQNNLGEEVPVTTSGPFEIPAAVLSGTTYSVTVKHQPTDLSQQCDVTNGTGTIGGGPVSNVVVTCVTKSFTVGVDVSGLAGSGLVLQNNLGDDLPISTNGPITFSGAILSGAPYSVTVKTQPNGPTQVCNVVSGSGTVTNGNVSSIAINCSTSSFTVGGSVTGLTGTGLVLTNNGGSDLTVNNNGSFTFGGLTASGLPYAVAVKTNPTVPHQTCVVTNASGTVGSGNVESVSIACTTNTYDVGGTVVGLTGTGLVLTNNGGNDLVVNSAGAFKFGQQVPSGGSYSVAVKTSPTGPAQTCVVTSGTGSGSVVSNAIASVNIACGIYPSNGSDGAFAPSTNVVLPPRVYNFTTISIPSGVTVTTSGTAVLDLRATGSVSIAGTIDLSGGSGGSGASNGGCAQGPTGGGGATGTPTPGVSGLLGCPAAGTGGSGGAGASNNVARYCSAAGGTYGGGAAGGICEGGGGGGGYAGGGAGGGYAGGYAGGAGGSSGGSSGGAGGAAGGVGGVGGVASGVYGGGAGGGSSTACDTWAAGGAGGGSIGAVAANDLAVGSTFYPGSGGGGGGGPCTCAKPGGGGGGGGGGALRIATAGTLTISGTVRANGGAGGASLQGAGGGGGGSGGVVFLYAPTLNVSGTVTAIGGAGGTSAGCGLNGGAGGLGRIRVSASSCSLGGTINPALPSCSPTNTAGAAYFATFPH